MIKYFFLVDKLNNISYRKRYLAYLPFIHCRQKSEKKMREHDKKISQSSYFGLTTPTFMPN